MRSGTSTGVRLDDLTDTQRRMLDLIAEGKTSHEIGQALGITLDGASPRLRTGLKVTRPGRVASESQNLAQSSSPRHRRIERTAFVLVRYETPRCSDP